MPNANTDHQNEKILDEESKTADARAKNTSTALINSQERDAELERTRSLIRQENKELLFHAMEQMGITQIEVNYNTQTEDVIESVIACDADNNIVNLPAPYITYRTIDFNHTSEPDPQHPELLTRTKKQPTILIENGNPSSLAIYILEDAINQKTHHMECLNGCLGTLTFDLPSKTATLELNERKIVYTTTEEEL